MRETAVVIFSLLLVFAGCATEGAAVLISSDGEKDQSDLPEFPEDYIDILSVEKLISSDDGNSFRSREQSLNLPVPSDKPELSEEVFLFIVSRKEEKENREEKTETAVSSGGNVLEKKESGKNGEKQSSSDQTRMKKNEEKVSPPVEKEDTKVLNEISAVKGAPAEIYLDGKGWIYLPAQGVDDVRYIDKKYTGDGTVFIFFFDKEGVRLLDFERQDNSKGITEKYQIKVTATGKGGTEESFSVITDSGEPFQKETDPAEDLMTALNGRDARSVEEILPDYLILPDRSPDVIFQALRFLFKKKGDVKLQMDLIDNLLTYYPDDMERTPELLYIMAQLLETNSPLKDLKKAYEYYQIVYTRYPVSIYSDKALERINYLDRHYFKVR